VAGGLTLLGMILLITRRLRANLREMERVAVERL
jgi:hypothetical protein